MADWTGKSAIVTGAGTGVGKAVSHELASRGATVYVTALTEEEAQLVVDEITTKGNKAIAAKTNVGDWTDLQSIIDRVVDEQGKLDLIVNNAGVLFVGEFYEMEETSIEKLLHINLTAVTISSLYAYRQMKRQGFGQIVNVSSMGGLTPNASMTAYGAAKHGVIGLSTSLGAEAKEFGVDVKSVCLGFVKSEMLNKAEMKRGGEQTVNDMLPFKPQPTDIAAKNIVNGIESKKRFVFTPFYARAMWLLGRLFPDVLYKGAVDTMAKYRKLVG